MVLSNECLMFRFSRFIGLCCPAVESKNCGDWEKLPMQTGKLYWTQSFPVCSHSTPGSNVLQCIYIMAATAVIGAGGPTGSECVKRLLELGQPAVAIVRNPDKYKDSFASDKNLTFISGDVTNVSSLKSAFQERQVKKVIFAASGKTYWSAKSVDEQVGRVQPSILSSASH